MDEDALDMQSNGFAPSDFSLQGVTEEQYHAYRADLDCDYLTPLSIRVYSETQMGQWYDVLHDRLNPTFCPCKQYQYKGMCKHWKRVKLVLMRRQARLYRSTIESPKITVTISDEDRANAPLNGKQRNAGFSLFK